MKPTPFFPEQAVRTTDGPQFSIHSLYYKLALDTLLGRLPDGFIDPEPALKAFVTADQEGVAFNTLVKATRPWLPPSEKWPKLRPTCGAASANEDPVDVFCHTWTATAREAAHYDRALRSARNFPYFKMECIPDKRTSRSHFPLSRKVFSIDDPDLNGFAICRPWGCRCSSRFMTRDQVKNAGLPIARKPFNLATFALGPLTPAESRLINQGYADDDTLRAIYDEAKARQAANGAPARSAPQPAAAPFKPFKVPFWPLFIGALLLMALFRCGK